MNTVGVGKNFFKHTAKNGDFRAFAGTNFRMVSWFLNNDELNTESVRGVYSTDTGMDGNIFTKHYFDMNHNHVSR